MGNIAPVFDLTLGDFADITGIQTKILLNEVRTRPLDHHSIQGSGEQLDIVGVRTTDVKGQGQALGINQQAPFAAFFFHDPWDFCPPIPALTVL